MDLRSQETILKLAEEHGSANVIVVLGAPEAESAGIAAETVLTGDPSYAGPLAGTQLGLAVYHVLEDEIRGEVPADVWDEQIGVMADVLDAGAVTSAVAALRGGASG